MIHTNQREDIWKNLLAINVLPILLFFALFINSNSQNKIKLGIDVLKDNNFNIIENKNVLILTNSSGRDSNGKLTVDILTEATNFQLIGILSPEHGFYTTVPAGNKIDNNTYSDIPIYSLYSQNKKPIFKELPDCDAVLVDIQDIGVRSYTYLSTIYKTMQEASKNNIEVVVLDRPNPLGGMIIDGNIIENEYLSFVGIISVPYIHGCTIGELALMINENGWLGTDNSNNSLKCNLNIVKMEGWQRWMHWEDTKLNWFPTSPHVPTIDAVKGLATLGIFGELGIISIGIGTTSPFQYIGSPNFETNEIFNVLSNKNLLGININLTEFQPFYGMYSSKKCNGFFLNFELTNLSRPYSTGILIFSIINNFYPNLFAEKNISPKAKKMFKKVTGTDLILEGFFNKKDYSYFIPILNKGLNEYIFMRENYLLYP